MTIPLDERYAELVALTQLYLLQEFSLTERVTAGTEGYAYFKEYAMQKKGQSVSKPVPVSQPVRQIVQEAPKLLTEPVPQADEPIPQQQATSFPKEKTASVKPKSASKTFEPELTARETEIDLEDIRKIVQERYPGQKIVKEIPSDAEAKAINEAWKSETIIPEVMILSFEESPLQYAFLQNIAKAITMFYTPAAVIRAEKLAQEKGWEKVLQTKNLKLIISTGHNVHGSPELHKHYKEAQKQAKHFLGSVPLFLLSDIAHYFKNPQLKVTLWKDLCEILGTPRP